MPNERDAMTLCDYGEEPIEVMIRGHVTDDRAKEIARKVMQDEDHDDIEEILEASSIVRRHTKWIPAPEGSPHDDIAETCKPDDEGAFPATHVIFP